MTRGIYDFHWDYGRHGDVEGRFVADSEEVKAAIGREIYFGEILGKHSEVYGRLKEGDCVLINDDQDFINMMDSIKGGCSFGHNPLDNITPVEEEIG